MKKFEKLFLHIGLEKTGTTTIQEFLHVNQKEIEKRGFLTLSSLGFKNHKLLCAYSLRYDSKDVAIKSQNIPSDVAAIDSFRSKVEQGVIAQASSSTAPNAIISSEDLSRLFNVDEVGRAVNLVKSIAEQIYVVVFVRRQDLLAVSRYYSLLLAGAKTKNIFPQVSDCGPFYNYHRNISLWADLVGRQNILIQVFPEVPKRENFDSVDKFCATIALDPAGLERTAEQNVSVDAINQIILREFNALHVPENRDKRNKLLKLLAPFNEKKYRFLNGAPKAREFYERFLEDNRRLFSDFAPTLSGFSDDFSMYPDSSLREDYQAIAVQRLLRLVNPQLVGDSQA